MELGLWLGLLVLFTSFLFISVIVLMAKRYKRCPSNRIMVIFGKVGGHDTARCIHGGAAFVWPLIQDYAYLSLEPIQIDVPLRDALSMENIRVNVPSVFTVAVGTEGPLMQNAAIRLLGLNGDQIKKQAEDIIFGQLRQVIASMKIEDINRDREQFLHSIQTSLEPELSKIGLVLINVNITDITDSSGYIEAIGQKAASQAVQQARGDVAEQVKLGEVRVAEAEREKSIQVAQANQLKETGIRNAQKEQAVRIAELEKEQQVGEKNAQMEKAVRIAELDKQQQVGEKTSVFLRESQVKDQERQMRIAVATADAAAIEGENISKARVASSNADLQIKQAEAFQAGESRRREAEAAVLEAQNYAMAKAAVAEAQKVEAERRAALEAPAKAEKAQTIVQAEAEAEKRRIEAVGEASAIFAKLEAEAKGQYEILAKKGEGLKCIIEACGNSEQAFQLLMLEHIDKMAELSAQAISNIKFDKVIVWETGEKGNGMNSTTSFLHGMARSLPPMMQVLRDVGGIELPDYLARISPPVEGAKTTTDTPVDTPKTGENK